MYKYILLIIKQQRVTQTQLIKEHMPKITFNIPEKEPQKVSLTLEHERISIGRKKPSDILIGHASISSKHCILKRINGGFELIDSKSTNGVHFQGARVSKITIKEDTKFHLGHVAVRFQYSEEELHKLRGKQPKKKPGKPKLPPL